MKIKRVLILIVLFFSLDVSARSLTCKTNTDVGWAGLDRVFADCEDGYSVEMGGIGISARIAKETIKISCPFQDDIDGHYGGVKVAIGLGGHLSGALFVGEGTCFIGGIGWGAGAAVNGAWLEIIKWGTLFEAIKRERYPTIQKQLNQIDPHILVKDAESRTPLIAAAEIGNIDIVKKVIEWKKPALNSMEWKTYINMFDDRGKSASHIASNLGYTEIVELLHDNHVNLNLQDLKGRTSLMMAVIGGNLSTVKVLLDRGADRHIPMNGDNTVLLMAAYKGHSEIVSLFLKRGANVNEKNKVGRTTLIMAGFSGSSEIGRILVERGANMNAQGTLYGVTSLMVAASWGHTKFVRFLVDHGADVNIRDFKGETAYDYASNFGEIRRILKNAEARAENSS